MSSRDQLKEMIEQGPVSSLFRAEQAEAYLDASGKFAKQIDSHRFGEFFIVYQAFAIDMFVVSITKMYEPQKNQYQLNSLPAILEFIKKHSLSLKIEQPNLLVQQVALDPELQQATKGLEGEALTIELISYLEQQMPKIESNTALDALKALRDKSVVHSERVEMTSLPKTSWESTKALLAYAQRFIGLIGNGYLSTSYTFPDGDYVLSQDAARLGGKTISLLAALGMDTSNKSNQAGTLQSNAPV